MAPESYDLPMGVTDRMINGPEKIDRDYIEQEQTDGPLLSPAAFEKITRAIQEHRKNPKYL